MAVRFTTPPLFLAWSVALVAGAANSAGSDVAAVRKLEGDLAANDSATQVLGRWCLDRHLADPPLIRALRDRRVIKPAGPEIRALLQAAENETIGYRRVRLVCGEHVLSEADNWYVPDRLTPAMNLALDRTDTPFGLVVRSLDYHRRRLDTFVPTQPRKGDYVLIQRALLTTGDGRPFSLVVERYTHDLAP